MRVLSIVGVLSPGLLMVVLALLNWKNRVAKFGPPPPKHHWGSVAFFLIWSLGYVLPCWLLPGYFPGLFVVPLLLVALDSVTLGLIKLPPLKSLPWSRKQQVLDGFMLASLFVFPLLLILVHR